MGGALNGDSQDSTGLNYAANVGRVLALNEIIEYIPEGEEE